MTAEKSLSWNTCDPIRSDAIRCLAIARAAKAARIDVRLHGMARAMVLCSAAWPQLLSIMNRHTAQLLLNTLESTYYAAVLPLRLLSAPAASLALWHSCATL